MTDIERISRLVARISTAGAEPAASAGQVHEAIVQLIHITQENPSVSEQVLAIAATLADQAEALQIAMSFFRTGTSEGASSKPASAVVDHRAGSEQTRDVPPIRGHAHSQPIAKSTNRPWVFLR